MFLHGYPGRAVSKAVLNPLFNIGDLEHGIMYTQPPCKPTDRLTMWVIPQNTKQILFICRGLVRGGMMFNLSTLKQLVLATHGEGSVEPGNSEPQAQCCKGFHRVQWEKAGR